jgi:hypothetical protein
LLDSAGRVFGGGAGLRVDVGGRAPIAASVRLLGTDTKLDLRLEVAREVLVRAESPGPRE